MFESLSNISNHIVIDLIANFIFVLTYKLDKPRFLPRSIFSQKNYRPYKYRI